MTKIACLKCGMFFHPIKNGVIIEEGMPRHGQHPDDPEQEIWESYKLYRADELGCPTCDNRIGLLALGNYHEHYLPGYKEERQALINARQLRAFIKDCV